ncbi:MAG: hypothetical protein ACYDH9_14450 [Limisphaerales bacterium]
MNLNPTPRRKCARHHCQTANGAGRCHFVPANSPFAVVVRPRNYAHQDGLWDLFECGVERYNVPIVQGDLAVLDSRVSGRAYVCAIPYSGSPWGWNVRTMGCTHGY